MAVLNNTISSVNRPKKMINRFFECRETYQLYVKGGHLTGRCYAGSWAGNFRLLSASTLALVAESGKITIVHGKHCGICISVIYICLGPSAHYIEYCCH